MMLSSSLKTANVPHTRLVCFSTQSLAILNRGLVLYRPLGHSLVSTLFDYQFKRLIVLKGIKNRGESPTICALAAPK